MPEAVPVKIQAAPRSAVVTASAPEQSDEPIVVITGWANAGTRVFTPSGPVAVSPDGSWQATEALAPGPNTLLIEAIGEDGAIVTDEITIQYEQDPEAVLAEVPFTAVQTFRASVDAEPFEHFSGTATPLSTVSIQSPYGAAGAVADSQGRWSTAVFFDAPGGPEPFTITVTAVNGEATFDFLYTPPAAG